jgi:pyrimidine deaminase RibD-like protein
MVVKADGRREAFDRNKIERGLRYAIAKRPVTPEQVAAMALELEREVAELGVPEIASRDIGQRVLPRLRELDQVAYVRFASIYLDFRDLDGFARELSALGHVVARSGGGARAQASIDRGRRVRGRAHRRDRGARQRGRRRDAGRRRWRRRHVSRARRPAAGGADEAFVQRALALAARAEGRTAPNPIVGCVIVGPDGRVRAEGFHARAGQPHAEAVALAALGGDARGCTVYVTLEPCAHTGRTPPCADALIRAGVARVVYGAADSDRWPRRRRPAPGPGRRRGHRRRARGGVRGRQRRLLHPRAARAAARAAQGRGLARRPGRARARLVALDHRRGGARRRPPATRSARRHHGRRGHRARRRSTPHLSRRRGRARSGAGRGRQRAADAAARRGGAGGGGQRRADHHRVHPRGARAAARGARAGRRRGAGAAVARRPGVVARAAAAARRPRRPHGAGGGRGRRCTARCSPRIWPTRSGCTRRRSCWGRVRPGPTCRPRQACAARRG